MATRGSDAWRRETWGRPCVTADIVEFVLYPGAPKMWIHRKVRPAFSVVGAILQRYGYIVRNAGGYNCRKITGGSVFSSHAWGISADINPDTNPYRRDRLVTDMPLAMREEIEAIRTAEGLPVFRGGWDWDGRPETPHGNYDAMHVECIATPGELAAGFVQDVPQTDVPTHYPVLRRGSVGPAVVMLQNLLALQRTTGNGTFGPRTEAAVRQYQQRHGLKVDGIVGAATWTALLSGQPVVTDPRLSPQK